MIGTFDFEARLDRSLTAVSIADPNQPDAPLVYVNPAFSEMTGFSRNECLGRNCRFLQGRGTNRAALWRIRSAVEARTPLDICLRNYRKCGEAFHNFLILKQFRYHGTKPLVLGCQFDLRPDTYRVEQHLEDVEGLFQNVLRHADEPWSMTKASLAMRSDAVHMMVRILTMN